MDLETAISTEPVRVKLRNLREHMPNQEDSVYQFGELLADRMNERVVPEGFLMASVLLLYDLEKGVNGYTAKPIESNLVGQPKFIYNLLSEFIPLFAAAACPEDFARQVEELYKIAHAKVKAKRARVS